MVQFLIPVNSVVQIMELFERLKLERERLGLTQPQMAQLLGVGKTTIIRWEQGASAPDAVQLQAFANAGADILFILIGQRGQPFTPEELLPIDERIMLDNYRHAPAAVQAGVKTTLGAFAPQESLSERKKRKVG